MGSWDFLHIYIYIIWSSIHTQAFPLLNIVYRRFPWPCLVTPGIPQKISPRNSSEHQQITRSAAAGNLTVFKKISLIGHTIYIYIYTYHIYIYIYIYVCIYITYIYILYVLYIIYMNVSIYILMMCIYIYTVIIYICDLMCMMVYVCVYRNWLQDGAGIATERAESHVSWRPRSRWSPLNWRGNTHLGSGRG